MILFVASKRDMAALNVAHSLLDLYDFEANGERFQGNPVYSTRVEASPIKLIFIEDESVQAQYVDVRFNPELVIFISRHESKEGIPTLSVHTPGNFGRADLGGISGLISISPANAMRCALLELFRGRNERSLSYEVSYEVTHHGPSLDVPAMFVELGSSEREWRDEEAAQIVARASMEAATCKSECEATLGIGGPHYNKKFTKLALERNVAFGHMIPNYALPYIDAKAIRQCILRTRETVKRCILDWKGIRGPYKKLLLRHLPEVKLQIEKI